MSRTQNAMKNIFFAMLSKMITLFLNFFSRTFFIYYLGNTYLGINGLFSEILTLLSFTELGFGTALNFSLYKPVADEEWGKTQRLLKFYKNVYRIIALIISVLGVSLVPFLQYLVKGVDGVGIAELRIYYIFFLLNTVVGYFVSYKYSLVNAQQKNYITTNYEFVSNTIIVLAQIITIVATRNYLYYLAIHTILLIISRMVLSIYLNKKFPVLKLKKVEPLSKEERKPIYLEVKGLILHQFASVAIHQTDNIIISSLTKAGVKAVGYISNYNMLINAVTGMVVLIFNNIVSGFGNLIATSGKKNFQRVFKELNFINFWIYGFCAIAFYILIPPFIQLWIGEQYLIDDVSFFLIVLNCYLMGQSIIYNNARNAYGNFNSDKWISFVQALINLVISVIGAKFLGLVGVYVGTILSRVWFVLMRPCKTYEMMFGVPVTEYYKQFFKYISSVLAIGVITTILVKNIVQQVTLYTFILIMGIVVIVPNLCFGILYCKTEEYGDVKERVKRILKREKNND